MSKFNRSVCHQCRRVFVKEDPACDFCSFLCQSAHQGVVSKGREIKKLECNKCGRFFHSLKVVSFCSDVCRKDAKSIKKSDVEKNKTDNALWVKNEHSVARLARGRKSVPLEELARRSEIKRVFDDDGWRHYLKGRKWDRI